MLPMPRIKSLLTFALFVIAIGLFPTIAHAQKDSLKTEKPVATEKKWIEKLSVKGYAQVRYNRLLETNPNLGCEQCDKSWGDNNGVFIRRARITFSGQVTDRVFIYVQPDFAQAVSTNGQHYLQVRDYYADLGLDKENNIKLRFGQSKVPFGFDNMQSSSTRLALDRSDALNSAAPNERDLGAFLLYTPAKIKKIYADIMKEGLKGSGDYGVFAFGVYNGQSANRAEQNNNLHMAARITYPFVFGGQIIEVGAQAYTGKFVVNSDQLSAGTKINASKNYLDQRAGASFVLYPKPFGFVAEYNFGRGPEFNTATDSIETKRLEGGYAQVCYKFNFNNQTFIPYSRAQYYKGGKKHEKDARSYDVKEIETGVEWLLNKSFEFTAGYVMSERRYDDFSKQNNRQKGQLLRLQVQMNF
jgi:hypothetical protein